MTKSSSRHTHTLSAHYALKQQTRSLLVLLLYPQSVLVQHIQNAFQPLLRLPGDFANRSHIKLAFLL